MNKKVLVTGGAGFIGSHIVDKLVASNIDVVIVDNLITGNKSNINNKAKFYNCDITSNSLEDIFFKEKPNYVIHLAAQICVPNATKDPINDATINIIGSINVINNCKKYNIEKLIVSSSAAVYGKPLYLPIDENHPTKPLSNYGLSKLCMEKYIELSGLNYIILRFSNVYGERQTPNGEAGVVTIFETAMKNNQSLTIYGDGEQIRDFIYVKDIASIVCKLLPIDTGNQIINVSTNNGTTINELFDKLSKKYSYTMKPTYKETRVGDLKNSILDNSKLKKYYKENFSTNL